MHDSSCRIGCSGGWRSHLLIIKWHSTLAFEANKDTITTCSCEKVETDLGVGEDDKGM